MNPKVSIIIPCYNCNDTLKEAVDSVFAQNLSIPFEIIMVNDGSTDNTWEIMESLAKEHKEITLAFHEKNKGGGATRNTGISMAQGRYIYCLDSDNFFGENSVEKMLAFLDNNNVDGVIFSEQRFFDGSNSKSYTSRFSETGRVITLNDLFNDSGIIVDNFFFTKESFERAGKYPEHHGFDTQGFEVRYISAGNKIMACPNTVFYHRMVPALPSYFEREYNNGAMSINYYLIFEEVFPLLTAEAKKLIYNYDIFKNSSLKENLQNKLKELAKRDELFAHTQNNELKEYEEVISLYKNGKYTECFEKIIEIVTKNEETPVLTYTKMRCETALSGITAPHIESETFKKIKDSLITTQSLYKKYYRYAFGRALISFFVKIKQTYENLHR